LILSQFLKIALQKEGAQLLEEQSQRRTLSTMCLCVLNRREQILMMPL
jgi:hypothetical protein